MDTMGMAAVELVAQVGQQFPAEADGLLSDATMALIDTGAYHSLTSLGLADRSVGGIFGLPGRSRGRILVRDGQRCLEHECDTLWW